jgi:hypothetical protein
MQVTKRQRRYPPLPVMSIYGRVGRFAHFIPKDNVARDSDGMENIQDFFSSGSDTESDIDEQPPSKPGSLSSQPSIDSSSTPSHSTKFEYSSSPSASPTEPVFASLNSNETPELLSSISEASSSLLSVPESPKTPEIPLRRSRKLFATPIRAQREIHEFLPTPPSPLSPRPSQPIPPIFMEDDLKRIDMAKRSFEHHEENRKSQVAIFSQPWTRWNDREIVFAGRILKTSQCLKEQRKSDKPLRVNNVNPVKDRDYIDTFKRRAQIILSDLKTRSPQQWTNEEWMMALRFSNSVGTLTSIMKKRKRIDLEN